MVCLSAVRVLSLLPSNRWIFEFQGWTFFSYHLKHFARISPLELSVIFFSRIMFMFSYAMRSLIFFEITESGQRKIFGSCSLVELKAARNYC